ncbi:MAG TPA: VWA domain-containing protein [Kiritimatiellia bacterium]|nr:VWA domain-containing protein [Kiritimatiellia bacterium]
MIFRYPWLLLLLLLVPAVLYLRYGWTRARASIRHSGLGRLNGLGGGWAVALRPLLPVLFGLALVLLVFALARPQRGMGQHRVHTEGVDIILLVDVSPSMLAEDFEDGGRAINRLDATKRVAEQFIRGRRSDRIGLVAFAALPFSVAPLTLDHGWLVTQLERLQPGDLGDATGIGTGLAAAVNRLRDSEAKSKLVVLLTDGVNNTGDITPENAALAAQALDIKVYTIGAGTDGIARIPVRDPFGGTSYIRQRSDIDEASLRRIADTTGAAYFRATDMEGLKRIFKEIDELEKTEIEVEQYTRYEERFQPLLLLALILLGLEQLLGLWRLERFP